MRHVVTLSTNHGADDLYYKSKFPDATFWSPTLLKSGSPPDVELFFVPAAGDEHIDIICYIPHAKLLVACDAIHNYPSGCSKSGGCRQGRGMECLSPALGLKGELTTPVPFIKAFKADAKALRDLFVEIMTRDFDAIICGHGPPATTDCKTRWATAISANSVFKGA